MARLRDLAERRLFLPRSLEALEGLERVPVRDMSLKAIRVGRDPALPGHTVGDHACCI